MTAEAFIGAESSRHKTKFKKGDQNHAETDSTKQH
ncbi:hypothetical protein IMSAGC012_01519 [Lachnospiraceae bacterium]|nr:hypothetical protein IMSAGC012_01519 [Lachnospiraceae bacterium]